MDQCNRATCVVESRKLFDKDDVGVGGGGGGRLLLVCLSRVGRGCGNGAVVVRQDQGQRLSGHKGQAVQGEDVLEGVWGGSGCGGGIGGGGGRAEELVKQCCEGFGAAFKGGPPVLARSWRHVGRRRRRRRHGLGVCACAGLCTWGDA